MVLDTIKRGKAIEYMEAIAAELERKDIRCDFELANQVIPNYVLKGLNVDNDQHIIEALNEKKTLLTALRSLENKDLLILFYGFEVGSERKVLQVCTTADGGWVGRFVYVFPRKGERYEVIRAEIIDDDSEIDGVLKFDGRKFDVATDHDINDVNINSRNQLERWIHLKIGDQMFNWDIVWNHNLGKMDESVGFEKELVQLAKSLG